MKIGQIFVYIIMFMYCSVQVKMGAPGSFTEGKLFLRILNVQKENAGTYRCNATINGQSVEATLQVNYIGTVELVKSSFFKSNASTTGLPQSS